MHDAFYRVSVDFSTQRSIYLNINTNKMVSFDIPDFLFSFISSDHFNLLP